MAPSLAGEGPQGPSYRRVLGQRPFFGVWLARLVSQSGDWVFEVALLWLVLELTRSVIDVTLVVTASIAPAVVLGPFLGVYVDRWNKRRTLVVTNLLEGVLVAGLSGVVLTHAVDLPLLVGIAAALGSGATVVGTATTSLVPELVGVADLSAANGLSTFSGSFNQVLGLTVGGLAVAALGVALPIEYDAVSFFVAAGIVAVIGSGVGHPSPRGGRAGGFGAEFREGFGFLRGERSLIELITIGAAINFFGSMGVALLAPYAKDVLAGSASTYGFLSAAIAGGGAIGAIAIGRIDTRRTAGWVMFLGVMVGGGLIAGLGLVRAVLAALALGVGVGVILSVVNVPLVVLMQTKTPRRLLGRVAGTFGALISVSAPAGAFLGGPFATRTSIPFVFLASGVVLSALAAVGLATMRDLRNVTYGDPVAPPAGAGPPGPEGSASGGG